MDWLQVIVLAFIQGVTEFLPISSSAHLILFPKILGWSHQGIAFDLAVHFGSLIAVCGYFRHQLLSIIRAWVVAPTPNQGNKESFLAWKIVLATIPIVVIAFLLRDIIDSFRMPNMIVFGMIFFALLLWHSDRYQQRIQSNEAEKLKNEYDMTMLDALLIGLSQVIAIIPGTSRSGITMTAAMYLKVDRVSAARFSFLLSIPTILLGTLWQTVKVIEEGLDMSWLYLFTAIGLSAFFAWITIHFFLKLIQTIKLDVFVIYRIVLGVFIFWLFF